jgi:hypothetical protein
VILNQARPSGTSSTMVWLLASHSRTSFFSRWVDPAGRRWDGITLYSSIYFLNSGTCYSAQYFVMFRLGLPLNCFIRLIFTAAEVCLWWNYFIIICTKIATKKTAQSWFPKGKEQAKTSWKWWIMVIHLNAKCNFTNTPVKNVKKKQFIVQCLSFRCIA